MTVVFLIRLRDALPNFKNPEINMISIGILEKYGYKTIALKNFETNY